MTKLQELLKKASDCPDDSSLDELSKELVRAGFPVREPKTIVLIALGPNRVQVPCRIFRTMEEAESFCEKHFGEPKDEEPHWGTTSLSKGIKVYATPPSFEMGRGPDALGLFEYYYAGCGAPWGFHLAEVDFESIFVGWDLD